MKQVTAIPEAERHVRHDPWLDKVLDGTLRLLAESDWKPRYKSTRSAASAIHQAASKRDMRATVAIRGSDLYVQGLNGAAPAKRARKTAPVKATAKKAGVKTTATKRTAKVA